MWTKNFYIDSSDSHNFYIFGIFKKYCNWLSDCIQSRDFFCFSRSVFLHLLLNLIFIFKLLINLLKGEPKKNSIFKIWCAIWSWTVDPRRVSFSGLGVLISRPSPEKDSLLGPTVHEQLAHQILKVEVFFGSPFSKGTSKVNSIDIVWLLIVKLGAVQSTYMAKYITGPQHILRIFRHLSYAHGSASYRHTVNIDM